MPNYWIALWVIFSQLEYALLFMSGLRLRESLINTRINCIKMSNRENFTFFILRTFWRRRHSRRRPLTQYKNRKGQSDMHKFRRYMPSFRNLRAARIVCLTDNTIARSRLTRAYTCFSSCISAILEESLKATTIDKEDSGKLSRNLNFSTQNYFACLVLYL